MTNPGVHRQRKIVVALVAAGIAFVPVTAIASAASPSQLAGAVTTTTVKASTSTTTPTSTTVKTTTATTATTTKKYEVIAGTFKTKAAADKRLAAITKKGITDITEVTLGKTAKTTRYRLEDKGITKVAAKAKVKALHADTFFAYYVLV
ncbi:MAG: hypothetical protein JWM34_4323 [Ilumatobacteraceae bacterium]|nr:hypothetical protein [Ilumatobacteraceae bacterium]